MNSMRAMGYSFEAAIADIVDNSVSAQARNIVLRFPIDPSDCCVAVCDDGIGMNKKELLDDETWNRLDMVLDEIENSVPYQQIYIDKSQNRVDDTVNDERIAEIESKARILIKMSMAMGAADRNAVIERLFQSEPFCKYPDLEEKLREA